MIKINAFTLKYSLLSIICLESLWQTYLDYRQYRKITKTRTVPNELQTIMREDTFEKAREYSLAKCTFSIVKSIFSLVVTMFIMETDFLASLWQTSRVFSSDNGEVATSCIWMFMLTSLSTVLDIPFNVYGTFVLEEKFGFNKQTAGFFIWDKIKGFILQEIFFLMLGSVIIIVIRNGGDYFFIWLWAVVCVIYLILLTIFPSYIAPLFDKYTTLPEGELRTLIENLATQLKFPLKELYVVEGSKRSSHSNAYFYGLFNSKRIVLFDTLIAKEDGTKCDNEEILAVVSHELGHWKHNHITKLIILMQINLFILFFIFGFMFNYPTLYEAFGFYNVQPVLVGLWIVLQYVMIPYNTLMSFLMTCFSRYNEFQADGFAVKLRKGEALVTSLIGLGKDNLTFPIYDNLYSLWNLSHPPLLERIQAIQKAKKD